MFWVYILENPRGNFYIGSTGNLQQRVIQHNPSPEDCNTSKFTHKNGPWQLVWSEEHQTRSSAIIREKQIKRMKSAIWIRSNLFNRQSESR